MIAQNNKHLARVDSELLEPISSDLSKQIFQNIEKVVDDVDLIILSDYAISIFSNDLIKDIVKLANKHDKTILMDPKGQDFSKYQGVDVLVPNYEEAMIATKSSKTKPIKKIAEVLRKTADKVVITRSSKGAYYFDGVDEIELPAVSKDVVDATGAGGSFVAFLGLGLVCSNFDYNVALPLANYAAAAAVKKVGTFAVTQVQLKEIINIAYNNAGKGFAK